MSHTTTESSNFEFDHFAQRPFYQRCPEWLIGRCISPNSRNVVDLGCGSGTLTALLLKRHEHQANLRITAIDPSEHELTLARTRIRDERVTFIQARAQDVGKYAADADAILLSNVIQLVPLADRPRLLRDVRDALKPGGSFGMNTLYYRGGVPASTRPFYVSWMLETRDYLKKHGACMKPLEQAPPVPPVYEELASEEYCELLRSAGLEEIGVEEIPFDWKAEDWIALSHYSEFIQGCLWPGIDLTLGSQALAAGVSAAYRRLQAESVRRNWLHIAAQRGRQPKSQKER